MYYKLKLKNVFFVLWDFLPCSSLLLMDKEERANLRAWRDLTPCQAVLLLHFSFVFVVKRLIKKCNLLWLNGLFMFNSWMTNDFQMLDFYPGYSQKLINQFENCFVLFWNLKKHGNIKVLASKKIFSSVMRIVMAYKTFEVITLMHFFLLWKKCILD